MADEQNQNRETKELSLSREDKSIMKFLVNPQIPESLSSKKDSKGDMISGTQSTPDASQASDSEDD